MFAIVISVSADASPNVPPACSVQSSPMPNVHPAVPPFCRSQYIPAWSSATGAWSALGARRARRELQLVDEDVCAAVVARVVATVVDP